MSTSFPISGMAPWSTARVSYAGWIPNVLGHLSFSLVGLKGRWANSHSLNHSLELDGTRSIAVRQDRIAQDYPYWDWVVRCVKPAAVQSYLMVATTHPAKIPFLNEDKTNKENTIRIYEDQQGLLCGTVFVTPRNRNIQTAKIRKSALNKIDQLLARGRSDAIDICTEATNVINDETDGGFPSIPYRFALFRTGEIRIWLIDEHISQAWLSGADKQKAIEEIFPKQVYYFLKDTLHTHYHHEPDSDQLLPLTRTRQVSKGNQKIEIENEVSWRRETLWGLARVISSYRRSNNIKNLRRAQGVLAYADAFQATVAKVFRPASLDKEPRFDNDLTTYDFAHTKQSVAALEGMRTWWNTGSVQILAGITAISLAAFTIWSSALRLKITTCASIPETLSNSDPDCAAIVSIRTEFVLNWILDHPLMFLGVFLALSTAVYQTIVRDVNYGVVLQKFSRFISSGAKAIGSSLGRKLRKPFFGFLITATLLVLISGTFIACFILLGSIMQHR